MYNVGQAFHDTRLLFNAVEDDEERIVYTQPRVQVGFSRHAFVLCPCARLHSPPALCEAAAKREILLAGDGTHMHLGSPGRPLQSVVSDWCCSFVALQPLIGRIAGRAVFIAMRGILLLRTSPIRFDSDRLKQWPSLSVAIMASPWCNRARLVPLSTTVPLAPSPSSVGIKGAGNHAP